MNEKIVRFKIPLLIASALLTGLTLVLPEFGFLEWIALIPAAAVLLLTAPDRKFRLCKFYGLGFMFFMVYYLVCYHWLIYMYPLEFLGVTKIEALGIVLISWLGLSALQSVTSALIFLVTAIAARTTAARKHPFIITFFTAALWTAFEWSQTIGWIGVPWGRLCLGQGLYTVMYQSASLFGCYVVSFILVAVNFCLAYLILNRDKRRMSAICAAAMFVGNLLVGSVVLISYKNNGEPVRVAAIQGNISSQHKWETGMLEYTYDTYEKLSVDAAGQGAQIIVFPETAVPTTVEPGNEAYRYGKKVASECNATMLIGAFTKREDGKYNSVLQVNSDGSYSDTIYSKRHLVPFGEYIPMQPLVEKIIPVMLSLSMTRLEEGSDPEIFDTEHGKIGSLICFDSIYDQLTIDSVRVGAELLVISTNDSWFSDSAGAYMHNTQAKFRAVESGRYVVRAANTGYSTIIDPTGKITADTEILTEGSVVGDVWFRSGNTFYTVIGNLFVYICIIVCAALFCFEIIYKIKQRKLVQ